MTAQDPNAPLLRHADQVLTQATALAAAHEGPRRAAFARLVGPHLRHVIEHFDALLYPARAGFVDYDGRPRDGRLEQEPSLAATRLRALKQALAACATTRLDDGLRVRGLAGRGGDHDFEVGSTMARELVFLTSHAVHHFALLREHCLADAIDIPPDFGLAPASVAHARTVPAGRRPTSLEKTP